MQVLDKDRIVYTWDDINAVTKSTLSFKKKIYNLCKKRKDETPKKILKNVCGIAYPGELLAIMGSSGAGKTSLLNALTFRSYSNLSVSGVRCINGIPVSKKVLTSKSAYVQQDDLFIGNLSVREHLIFQALMRMGSDTSKQQKRERVEEVIEELGLSHCQHSQIGISGRIKGISGGELRRLSFAAEVLTDPNLMFCDEPTSGLDSFMASNVVQILKHMAAKGKTIICTIHQPSSEVFLTFDKLLLMAEGRAAFYGTIEAANEFFKELGKPCPTNYNPADHYIQTVAIMPGKEEACRKYTNSVCDKFEKSPLGIAVNKAAKERVKTTVKEDKRRGVYKASWCLQLQALLWRSCLTVIKEPLLIRVRLIQTSILAIIIGLTYYGQELNQNGVMNINGALFILLNTMTIQNVIAVINVFCCELPVFLREHYNGMYRTDVYFISKTFAELPAFIITPFVFTAICYYMIGMHKDVDRFFIACGILILVTNVSASFGYLISCASTTLPMALNIGPALIIPVVLFGGFLLNIESIPKHLKWLTYLSWFRFSNEALLINQWGNVSIECSLTNPVCIKNGDMVLKMFDYSEDQFMMDIIMLMVLLCGFRILAFFALLIKTYQYK